MKKMMTMGMLAAVVLLAGCGKKDAVVQTAKADLPPVFVSEPIAGTPVPIPEARKAEPGDEIVLTGLVMGVPNPFVEGRAVFVLGDEGTVTPCDAMGDDDHCPTPWDACCDPAELKQAGTAAIQVVGENGRPVKTGLKGVSGLKELSRVTVSGTVAQNSTPDAFIVNASAIHVGVR
ncbi:hypothetical protein EGM51_00865 [Verrucomicrobia bacterium S94]|nr:hypothetical protein EGM51_00865 [Verrucomicrobia bacterium S94]